VTIGGAHGGGAVSVATVGRIAYRGWAAGAAEIAEAGPAPANIVKGRLRWAWLWSTIWLVYLVQPIQTAWRHDSAALRVLGTVAVGLFAILFIVAFWGMRLLRRRGVQISRGLRLGVLAAQVALILAAGPAIGEDALGMLVYLVVTAFFAVPTRAAMAIAGSALLLVVVLPHLVHGWEPEYNLAFSVFATSIAMWGILQIVERNFQLAAAHSEIARLAVADERNRFARDLHDILGHTLTVITVKAELAGRLVRLAPERAEAEIADLEGIARQALQDVRAAVSGYREMTLAGELASASTALSAAGIEADLPDTVDSVPVRGPGPRRFGRAVAVRPGVAAEQDFGFERQEVFAWVVREGVTNVVRHSAAKRCRIRVTANEVEIADDGRGPSEAPDGAGHGLAGLRERAEAAGGTMSVGRSAEGGFLLRVRVP
jgi:two-component system, NarL family, sensor histidine kinase DesK